jgi:hypothetical protein
MLGARIKPMFEDEARERQGARTDLSANLRESLPAAKASEQAAQAVQVSPRSVAFQSTSRRLSYRSQNADRRRCMASLAGAAVVTGGEVAGATAWPASSIRAYLITSWTRMEGRRTTASAGPLSHEQGRPAPGLLPPHCLLFVIASPFRPYQVRRSPSPG